MTTKEILKSLQKNQVLRSVIPQWAHCSIPYPFFLHNRIPCLGIYYYGLRQVEGKRKIQTPLFQVKVIYPTGSIAGISTCVDFVADPKELQESIGEYPSGAMQGLSKEDGDALYESYYSACDDLLQGRGSLGWQQVYAQVKEEGMERFFALLAPIPAGKDAEQPPKSVEKASAPVAATSPVAVKQPVQSLKSVIEDMQSFLDKPFFAQQLKEMQEIVKQSQRREYTIAVIGEFSRGKTTFVNQLLDLECLPVGVLPTTAVLTRISPAVAPKAAFVAKGGQCELFELNSDNLERFLADDQGRDPEGILELATPIPWLKQQRVCFYDTPGAGDVVGKRADITRAVIGKCDATIMAISAQMACSMTEMTFLNDAVLLKSVPRCFVLITKLDLIDEHDRMRVVSFVKQRILDVMPNAQFWVASDVSGVDASALDAVGINSIRQQIAVLSSSDEEAARLRRQQLSARLQGVLMSARCELEQLAAAEKLSQEERQNAVQALASKRESLEQLMDELLQGCDKRRLNAEQEIKKEIEDFEDSLLEDSKMSLSKASSIKDWIETDFPYLVKRGMKGLRGRLEKEVLGVIASARGQLGEELRQKLSVEKFSVAIPSSFELSLPQVSLEAEGDNSDLMRQLARYASMAVCPLAYMLVGPLGGVLGGGFGLGVNFFMNKRLEEQKRLVEERLQPEITKAFGQMQSNCFQYLKMCFGDLKSSLHKEAMAGIERAIEHLKGRQDKPTDSPVIVVAPLQDELKKLMERL